MSGCEGIVQAVEVLVRVGAVSIPGEAGWGDRFRAVKELIPEKQANDYSGAKA
jgi:hypothetical protein